MIIEYTEKGESIKTWVIGKGIYCFYGRVKICRPGEIKILKIRLMRYICKPVKLLRALGAGFAGLQNQHYAVF